MGLVNTIAFLAVSLAAAKTSQFIRATFNAQYYKVERGRMIPELVNCDSIHNNHAY